MTSDARGGERIVACPGCGAPTPYSSANPWRPFCCERCKNGDLGAWSSESYRVAAAPPEADEELPDAPPPGGAARRH